MTELRRSWRMRAILLPVLLALAQFAAAPAAAQEGSIDPCKTDTPPDTCFEDEGSGGTGDSGDEEEQWVRCPDKDDMGKNFTRPTLDGTKSFEFHVGWVTGEHAPRALMTTYRPDQIPWTEDRKAYWSQAAITVRCRRYNLAGIFTVVIGSIESVSGYAVEAVPDEQTASGGTGGGGGDRSDTFEYYICWYYLYADGSRSSYYRCDPV
jgi:hypothetical protein